MRPVRPMVMVSELSLPGAPLEWRGRVRCTTALAAGCFEALALLGHLSMRVALRLAGSVLRFSKLQRLLETSARSPRSSSSDLSRGSTAQPATSADPTLSMRIPLRGATGTAMRSTVSPHPEAGAEATLEGRGRVESVDVRVCGWILLPRRGHTGRKHSRQCFTRVPSLVDPARSARVPAWGLGHTPSRSLSRLGSPPRSRHFHSWTLSARSGRLSTRIAGSAIFATYCPAS